MNPGPLDWIFLAVLVLVVPLEGRRRFNRMKNWIRRGAVSARMTAYRFVLVEEWVLAAAVLALFLVPGRPLQPLLLGAPQGRLAWLGVLLSVGAVAFLLYQHLSVRRHPGHLEELRSQLDEVRELIPSTPREARWFRVLSLTAGLCEELLYRGFVMALLSAVLPLPIAFVLCNLAFGLGHLYQGPKGILKTAIVGAVLGALALLSGSLWPAMVVHAAVDWNSGELGRLALRQAVRPAADPQATVA